MPTALRICLQDGGGLVLPSIHPSFIPPTTTTTTNNTTPSRPTLLRSSSSSSINSNASTESSSSVSTTTTTSPTSVSAPGTTTLKGIVVVTMTKPAIKVTSLTIALTGTSHMVLQPKAVYQKAIHHSHQHLGLHQFLIEPSVVQGEFTLLSEPTTSAAATGVDADEDPQANLVATPSSSSPPSGPTSSSTAHDQAQQQPQQRPSGSRQGALALGLGLVGRGHHLPPPRQYKVSFPFVFQVPNKLPPSVTTPHGGILYRLTATLTLSRQSTPPPLPPPPPSLPSTASQSHPLHRQHQYRQSSSSSSNSSSNSLRALLPPGMPLSLSTVVTATTKIQIFRAGFLRLPPPRPVPLGGVRPPLTPPPEDVAVGIDNENNHSPISERVSSSGPSDGEHASDAMALDGHLTVLPPPPTSTPPPLTIDTSTSPLATHSTSHHTTADLTPPHTPTSPSPSSLAITPAQDTLVHLWPGHLQANIYMPYLQLASNGRPEIQVRLRLFENLAGGSPANGGNGFVAVQYLTLSLWERSIFRVQSQQEEDGSSTGGMGRTRRRRRRRRDKVVISRIQERPVSIQRCATGWSNPALFSTEDQDQGGGGEENEVVAATFDRVVRFTTPDAILEALAMVEASTTVGSSSSSATKRSRPQPRISNASTYESDRIRGGELDRLRIEQRLQQPLILAASGVGSGRMNRKFLKAVQEGTAAPGCPPLERKLMEAHTKAQPEGRVQVEVQHFMRFSITVTGASNDGAGNPPDALSALSWWASGPGSSGFGYGPNGSSLGSAPTSRRVPPGVLVEKALGDLPVALMAIPGAPDCDATGLPTYSGSFATSLVPGDMARTYEQQATSLAGPPTSSSSASSINSRRQSMTTSVSALTDFYGGQYGQDALLGSTLIRNAIMANGGVYSVHGSLHANNHGLETAAWMEHFPARMLATMTLPSYEDCIEEGGVGAPGGALGSGSGSGGAGSGSGRSRLRSLFGRGTAEGSGGGNGGGGRGGNMSGDRSGADGGGHDEDL